MRSRKDPRHIARILAVMHLYEFFFSNDEKLNNTNHQHQNERFIDVQALLKTVKNHSKKLEHKLIKGVKKYYEKADQIINENSTLIKSEDLELLTLIILRFAIYEGFISKITPPKVAIDEAIELTKDFGLAESETKKVAGILGRIITNTNFNSNN